jgi:hypothetical protein
MDSIQYVIIVLRSFTIIIPVVLYGYETWFLTLMEEHRLKVSEKRAPRKLFATKAEEAGDWEDYVMGASSF